MKKAFLLPKPSKEQRLKDRIERLTAKAKARKEPRVSDLKKIVQKKVNAYIRARDAGEPCLACGKVDIVPHASHYISQGSSGALRYHPDNIHVTCNTCNLFKHGNLIEYRIGLVNKIGEDKVKWLEEHRHDIKKWTKEELNAIMESITKPLTK